MTLFFQQFSSQCRVSFSLLPLCSSDIPVGQIKYISYFVIFTDIAENCHSTRLESDEVEVAAGHMMRKKKKSIKGPMLMRCFAWAA